MTSNVAKMMAQIDEMLAKRDGDAGDLWALLTALRGPDSAETNILKRDTTAQLRDAVLPKTRDAFWDRDRERRGWRQPFVPAMTFRTLPLEEKPIEPYDPQEHFLTHFNEAVKAFNRRDQ